MMFAYNSITPDNLITITFEAASANSYVARSKESGLQIGTVSASPDGKMTGSNDFIQSQFDLWAKRPEQKVGKLVNVSGRTLDQLISMYEELIVGCYILNHPDEKVDSANPGGYAKMIDWLRSTDFYRAPASTQYHESFVGGLLVHSLKVYNEALLLHQSYQYRSIPISQIALVALVHDWCKIALYTSYKRNVKNEETGQWEQVEAFKRNQKGLPMGHGATSMWLASKHFDLTDEEALAIRWHQGRWNVCDAEINEFQQANERYPLVHLLQFADQLSITEYRNE